MTTLRNNIAKLLIITVCISFVSCNNTTPVVRTETQDDAEKIMGAEEQDPYSNYVLIDGTFYKDAGSPSKRSIK